MTQPIHAIILAAGQGTRMKSALPKVLHAVGGKPMLGHVIEAAWAAGAAHVHVVLGHAADQVRAWLATQSEERLHIALQARQLGTAHAVQQALTAVPDDALAVVLYGDVPLISSDLVCTLAAAADKGLALVTAHLPQPCGYGRVLRDAAGRISSIVEEQDASAGQRAIQEINTGLLAAPARRLRRWLAHVKNDNAKQEYYLTDVVALAARDGVEVQAVPAPALDEVEGVNDRAQLAQAERQFQRRQAGLLMRQGLALTDPARFDLRGRLRFGRDVHIDVGCVLEGEIDLGDEVHIGPYCVLRNVRLGAGTRVDSHSVLDSAEAGANCRIGPFARLRPGSSLADEVHIGNFVELKKTAMGQQSKASHLAYLGDAAIGARVNVGAGVVTCNYDGASKHATVVGDDCFIGSDSQLVAPLVLGRGSYIAAGSTITRDTPEDALTICRAREQRSIRDWPRPEREKPE
jgi:bifunctional UDP-N-acetylglucosamine pyrophosphorylase/glucosamine-1-phosphate N-acetyltransferase